MDKEKLIINENFNREFALLVRDCTLEINMLFSYLSVNDTLEEKRRALGISARAKMALVIMYYTGRDAIHTTFKDKDIRRDFFSQELYLNYEEFFLLARNVCMEKEIDFDLSEFAVRQAHERFYNLLGSQLSIYAVLNCLEALYEDFKDVCDFSMLQVGWARPMNHWTLGSIVIFQKAYGVKIVKWV